MGLKKYIPWWGKIAVKLLLSRLPIDYRIWKKLALFEHGSMENPHHAYCVFKQHFDRVNLPEQFVTLELGPGDSLCSALTTLAFGGNHSYLVDAGAYADRDPQLYQKMAQHLTQLGHGVPDISDCASLDTILEICTATYLSQGLHSLKTIPDHSVDLIWSNVVLEHIRLHEFLPTLQELRRIIKPQGVCSHQIDLRDHLGGGLNNLRFSPQFWEQDWFANAGFYTNRLNYQQIIDAFESAQFSIKVVQRNSWQKLPITRNALAADFKTIPENILSVCEFAILAYPI